MSWGVSENATEKEKFWSEINDTLKGHNSVGNIDYKTYCELYDELRIVFDKYIKHENKAKLEEQ